MKLYENRITKRFLFLLICLIIVLAGAGIYFFLPDNRLNVVLISIDTLRPDHLGCYGYPQKTSPTIDGLAREGVRFQNAVSTTTWTLPAHLAMLTSLNDYAHGVIWDTYKLEEERITLAEIFKKKGYTTIGVFTGPYLHPIFGFHQGFDQYIDAMVLKNKNSKDFDLYSAAPKEITTPNAMKNVKALLKDTGKRPFFLFLHLFDVHHDFIPHPPYDTLFDPGYNGPVNGINPEKNPAIHKDMSSEDLAHIKALYDGEIRFVDEEGINILVNLLKDKGIINNTLIIITSDHGEEFFEHNIFGHRQNLYGTTLHVPLIVWCPKLLPQGVTIEEPVSIIDIMPTILELAGLPSSPESQGVSLVPLINGKKEKKRPLFSELVGKNVHIESIRTGDSKVILNYIDKTWEYFDLKNDPFEKQPIIQSSDPIVKKTLNTFNLTRRDLIKYRQSISTQKHKPIELDPQLRKKLESLGYINKK